MADGTKNLKHIFNLYLGVGLNNSNINIGNMRIIELILLGLEFFYHKIIFLPKSKSNISILLKSNQFRQHLF